MQDRPVEEHTVTIICSSIIIIEAAFLIDLKGIMFLIIEAAFLIDRKGIMFLTTTQIFISLHRVGGNFNKSNNFHSNWLHYLFLKPYFLRS